MASIILNQKSLKLPVTVSDTGRVLGNSSIPIFRKDTMQLMYLVVNLEDDGQDQMLLQASDVVSGTNSGIVVREPSNNDVDEDGILPREQFMQLLGMSAVQTGGLKMGVVDSAEIDASTHDLISVVVKNRSGEKSFVRENLTLVNGAILIETNKRPRQNSGLEMELDLKNKAKLQRGITLVPNLNTEPMPELEQLRHDSQPQNTSTPLEPIIPMSNIQHQTPAPIEISMEAEDDDSSIRQQLAGIDTMIARAKARGNAADIAKLTKMRDDLKQMAGLLDDTDIGMATMEPLSVGDSTVELNISQDSSVNMVRQELGSIEKGMEAFEIKDLDEAKNLEDMSDTSSTLKNISFEPTDIQATKIEPLTPDSIKLEPLESEDSVSMSTLGTDVASVAMQSGVSSFGDDDMLELAPLEFQGKDGIIPEENGQPVISSESEAFTPLEITDKSDASAHRGVSDATGMEGDAGLVDMPSIGTNNKLEPIISLEPVSNIGDITIADDVDGLTATVGAPESVGAADGLAIADGTAASGDLMAGMTMEGQQPLQEVSLGEPKQAIQPEQPVTLTPGEELRAAQLEQAPEPVSVEQSVPTLESVTPMQNAGGEVRLSPSAESETSVTAASLKAMPQDAQALTELQTVQVAPEAKKPQEVKEASGEQSAQTLQKASQLQPVQTIQPIQSQVTQKLQTGEQPVQPASLQAIAQLNPSIQPQLQPQGQSAGMMMGQVASPVQIKPVQGGGQMQGATLGMQPGMSQPVAVGQRPGMAQPAPILGTTQQRPQLNVAQVSQTQGMDGQQGIGQMGAQSLFRTDKGMGYSQLDEEKKNTLDNCFPQKTADEMYHVRSGRGSRQPAKKKRAGGARGKAAIPAQIISGAAFAGAFYALYTLGIFS